MRVAAAIVLLGCAAAAQQLPSDYIGLVRQGPDLLLEIRDGAAGPADRLELRLSKPASREASLAFGPEGWTALAKGSAVTLEGPGLAVFPALFRVRIGAAKTPAVARIRISVLGESIAERDVGVLDAPPPAISGGIDGLLALPAVAFAGESIVARMLMPRATSPLGSWFVDGGPADPLGPAIRLTVPDRMDGESLLAVRFDDPWGRTTVRGQARMLVETAPGRMPRPRLDAVQPIALAGESITVCGWFPQAARAGVLLDGKAGLELVAGSARSLVYTLPETTPPGRRFVSGDPDAGYPDAILPFQAIRLDTQVDSAMRPPQVRIKVVGTTEPVRVRAVNLDPFAASLVGGESQIVETDGGLENIATIEMQPSAFPVEEARNLDIAFTLAQPTKNCGAPGLLPASASGRRVAN